MNESIKNNADLNQLELYFDNVLVGRVEYSRNDKYIDFKFIFVNPEYRGMKISSKLAQIAYDFQKEVSLPSKVSCGVLNGILKKSSEFDDFVWL